MIRIIVFCIGVTAVASAFAEDWPQFRGPNCTGISTAAAPLPVDFSETEGVTWTAKLGDGIGCPVVAAGRVFTSAMVDDETVGLFAFDAATGDELWHRTWPVGDIGDTHKTNSHASTTPVADAERVYFYFGTLGMITVDAMTGKDVWRKELPVPYFVFKWGAGMSPVLYRDLLLFCQDDDLNPAFYAFDKRTGKLKWKDDRNDMSVNYSHPVICKTDEGDEIVVAGTGILVGYDPTNGKRLWQAKTLLRNIKTTPVCKDGVIYISLQSGGIANQWLASVDRAETGNNDGKLTREEIQAFVGNRTVPEKFFEKTFGRGDLDGDGDLEGRELDIAFLHSENFAGASYDAKNPAAEFILAVRGGGRGDVTDTHVLWKHSTKHTDHIVSPIILDNRMLLVKCGGIATCFDTGNGDKIFGPVRIGNEGDYFASPICGDGKIYVASENGKIVVLRDSNELEVLAVNDMGDSILGTPAIADGALFVRTRKSLMKIQ
ncbi:outer membrane protein assembly factor BamB family protein [Rubinisphaera italica]|uniref:Outer membrane biogenesis protein BamB n=1 Tax=Rubinisphaera italica TaxID=2527969 RepID=A0A5C5XCB4_9PLAN|nr:PQQ-binding-like beta-propeller repeat protein [Rubinisphaera italica]TWT60777.1 outer membrane biogenesis protein BamB [Rubinisphaera italica]